MKKKSFNKSWYYFFVVLFIYIALLFFDKKLFFDSSLFFLKIFKKVALILIVIFVLMSLINYFFSRKKISKYLGESSGFKGWLIAIFGGIISHGPIYVWYPLLKELKGKGMKYGLISTFIYNRAIKIPLLSLMIVYFSGWYVLVLTLVMILFSVFLGFLTEFFMKKKLNKGKNNNI